jgi:hypothetical protein
MRTAVLPILVVVFTACAGSPEPALLITIAEVTADRVLDGDLAGAVKALAGLTRV